MSASDIAGQLEKHAQWIEWDKPFNPKTNVAVVSVMREAAAEIERLRASKAKLVEALESAINFIDAGGRPAPDHELIENLVQYGRAALA